MSTIDVCTTKIQHLGSMHKKGGMACKPSPLSGGPSRTHLNCPNRASIFRLILGSPDWTKAVVNAKKIPANEAGIFNFRPKPCWAGLRIQHSLAALTRHPRCNEQKGRTQERFRSWRRLGPPQQVSDCRQRPSCWTCFDSIRRSLGAIRRG